MSRGKWTIFKKISAPKDAQQKGHGGRSGRATEGAVEGPRRTQRKGHGKGAAEGPRRAQQKVTGRTQEKGAEGALPPPPPAVLWALEIHWVYCFSRLERVSSSTPFWNTWHVAA